MISQGAHSRKNTRGLFFLEGEPAHVSRSVPRPFQVRLFPLAQERSPEKATAVNLSQPESQQLEDGDIGKGDLVSNQGHLLPTTSCGIAIPCATGKESWCRAESDFGNEKKELKGEGAKT